FSYESVFRYLKTGFAGICDEEIDLLENYVLERGIRGKKAWMSDEPWENGNLGVFDAVLQIKSGEEDYTIDNIRKKVIAPFMEFEKNFEGRKTIKQICTALFEFLDKGIGLADKINACVEEFISAGHMSEAEQFKQIWNILIDVLDQLVAVMGDDLCGMERFGELIRTGLSKYEIGIIPSAVDQVSIGTIDRSKSTDVKVLFIMGAVYGKIPNTSLKEGILSDRDRRILAKYGMEVAPDTRAKVFDEQFKVYKAVTAASEKLYISFPVADTEGKAQRSAYLVADIKRLFPNLKQRDNLLLDIREDFNLAAAPEPAFYHMIAVLSKGAPYHSVWDDAYAWYAEHDEWKDKLNIIERAKQYKNTSAMLDIEKVNKLYGENPVYSISRLETFSQCQFRYFLEHGLKARERRVWSVKSFDIGNLMHYVIRQFCMNVEKNSHTLADIKKDWHELTDEASEAIIRTLMKEAEEKIMSSQPQDSGRIKFLLSQIENTLRRSVKMIAESLQMGEFAAVGYEQAFSDFEIACGNGRKIKLRGIIDRIDLLETNDRAYIRIIDYKSGSKIFDIKRIYNNLDFQLMIYAQAAVELYKCGRLLSKQGKPVQIAGVLYCTLKDPMVFVSGPHDIDENEIKKQIKLNGLLLDDIKIIRMMDRRVASETAEELIARGIKKKDIDLRSESGYLNVTTTKTTGELSKKSSLASEQNIRCLADYVNRSIAHVDEKIKNGYIGISPFKESDAKNACTYCPYGEVCLFDAAADKYRLPKKLKDDIWDSFAMGGESDGEMDK
ncbi:MAG: PD-(D/E)XK nuclease family protein, partial [Clostridia bacterium]|nr:PD-(D/E)XK nuclease family protein [Clostridia bacterium]